jgi:hypothetical protein
MVENYSKVFKLASTRRACLLVDAAAMHAFMT